MVETNTALTRMIHHWGEAQMRANRDRDTTSRLGSAWRWVDEELEGLEPVVGWALFRALGRLPRGRVPSREVIGEVASLLHSYRSPELWLAVEDAIDRLGKVTDRTVSFREPIVELAEALKVAKRKRQLASVELAPMVPVLRALLGALLGRGPRVAIVPGPEHLERDVLSASTDGHRIRLPPRIALTSSKELNTLAYVRLLAHEAEHIHARSFDVPEATLERGPLGQRLNGRRARYARRLGSEYWSELGISKPPEGTPRPIIAAALHVESPRLLLYLHNVVEDTRIEGHLAARLPVFRQLAACFDGHENALAPHPALRTAADNFCSALFSLLRDQPVRHPIARRYQRAWSRVQAISEAARARPPQSSADALVVAVDLHDALVERLPNDAVITRLADELDPTFVTALATGGAQSVEHEDDSGEPVNLAVLPEDDWSGSGRRGWTYPELDRDGVTLVQKAAHVFEEDAPKDVVRMQAPPRDRGASSSIRGLEGDVLDFERAYDYLVGRRIGRVADERVYRRAASRTPSGRLPRRMATFVVDLSQSMTAEVGPSGPIEHVRSLLAEVVPALERVGVETGVYGALDSGRRDVNVFPLKVPDARCDGPWLSRVKPRRFGGFRHGALVRHFASRLPERWPGAEHTLFIITDTASHYLSIGLEAALSELWKKCAGCPLRNKGCDEEPRAPSVFVGDDTTTAVFLSTLTEVRDLAHAVQGAPIQVRGVLVGPHYRDATLDRAFAPDHWTRILDAVDVDVAAAFVRRAVAPAGGARAAASAHSPRLRR